MALVSNLEIDWSQGTTAIYGFQGYKHRHTGELNMVRLGTWSQINDETLFLLRDDGVGEFFEIDRDGSIRYEYYINRHTSLMPRLGIFTVLNNNRLHFYSYGCFKRALGCYNNLAANDKVFTCGDYVMVCGNGDQPKIIKVVKTYEFDNPLKFEERLLNCNARLMFDFITLDEKFFLVNILTHEIPRNHLITINPETLEEKTHFELPSAYAKISYCCHSILKVYNNLNNQFYHFDANKVEFTLLPNGHKCNNLIIPMPQRMVRGLRQDLLDLLPLCEPLIDMVLNYADIFYDVNHWSNKKF